MSFPKYPDYRNTDIEWLGNIPTHWELKKIRHLTECLDGRRVPLNSQERADRSGNVPYWGANAVMDYVDAPLFDEELVLLGEDGAPFFDKNKPVAFVSSGPVWPNNHIHVLRPKVKDTSKILTYALNVTDYVEFIDGSTRDKLTQSSMNAIPIAWPPQNERIAIANFLDYETSKIDKLIAEQEKLINLLKEKFHSLVLGSFKEQDTVLMRLTHAADLIQRPVTQKYGEMYEALGLYNRGRGLFHKEPRSIDEMGDSDFFWVKCGDLIFSGQFAWEGSVAMAYEEEENCVVSHRYPVIRGKVGIALTEYLFALFTTSHGDFLLNECSIGAAGRNRPLNINLLLKEKIPIPNIKTQEQIVKMVRQRRELLVRVSRQRDLLLERRSSLIRLAVTGQIDIRDVAIKLEE